MTGTVHLRLLFVCVSVVLHSWQESLRTRMSYPGLRSLATGLTVVAATWGVSVWPRHQPVEAWLAGYSLLYARLCVYVSVCLWALFATPRVDLASRAQTLAGKDDLTVRASDFIQSAQRYQRRGAYCRTSPPPFRGQNPGEYLAMWWSFYVSHVTGQEQK